MVTVELQGLAETIARWVDPVPGIDAISEDMRHDEFTI
jgi:hypothetical protein